MGKLIDLTGQKFGRLLVIKKAEKYTTQVKWVCKCDCGKIKEIAGQSLRNGATQSCGCLQKEITIKNSFKDLSNQRFGKLIALYPTGNKSGQNYIWHCQCDCGQECDVRGGDLTNGHTSSCGCLQTSLGEQNISKLLKENNIEFKTQYTFESCRYPNSNYLVRFDFYLPELNRIIEFDGIQHFQANGGWNNAASHSEVIKKDLFRNEWAAAHNIPLVRIPYWERDNITLEMIMGDKYLISNAQKGE